jgi:hypothetical protein
MNDELHDCYVVFLRDRASSVWHPERAEQAIAACPSYAEAAKLSKQYRRDGKDCIIRCVGQTGGSD